LQSRRPFFWSQKALLFGLKALPNIFKAVNWLHRRC
jgi:hypothetical protein